ncbi:alpha/beta hydrolase family esterase [Nocardia iowensis]|uniref:Phospholipase/carboxylesterase/thioesterase domain-containing protein n=1 Tax=Nocardia iowensis TaxID=204891 RepID=A0ABX8RRI1_NOCIO|nr:PHB depolymerase family esterase [Nocardia iowensis]QXN91871.1 hypothetical protein KV110_01360 [Nocardia iowensis]
MEPKAQHNNAVRADQHFLDHEHRRRRYTLVRRAAGTTPGAALIMVLHGTAQSGESVHERHSGLIFDELARTGNAVIAYPSAVRREWNGARKAVMLSPAVKTIDDVGFLSSLISEITARCPVDAERVLVIGYSLGGHMAIRLVHDAPELLVGAMLIGTNQPAPGNLESAGRSATPLPMVLIHGTADPWAPYDGGVISWRGHFPKGEHLSALQTAEYFAARNGINVEPSIEWLPGKPAPTELGSVSRTEYRQIGCPSVRLYSIVGGGHQIPGHRHVWPWLFGISPSTLSAASVAAEFLGITLRSDEKR